MPVDRQTDGFAVDLEHLRRYTAGDRVLELELLTAFLPNAGGYIEAMENTDDAEAWFVAAHSLKGASRGIGAFSLGEAAEAAEPHGAAPDDQRRSQVESLRRELARVADFVRHFESSDI